RPIATQSVGPASLRTMLVLLPAGSSTSRGGSCCCRIISGRTPIRLAGTVFFPNVFAALSLAVPKEGAPSPNPARIAVTSGGARQARDNDFVNAPATDRSPCRGRQP